jgi:xanthine dehydrogenase accessory factor
MSHDHSDIACAMAHGDVPAPTGERRLVAVFASPVALQLVHLAAHVGFDCVVVDPARDLDGARTFRSAAQAGIDDRTDVVVTDHDRPELGDVLVDVLSTPARWVGVMGSPRHTAPHVAALQERGLPADEIARVHRPIGLDIGSRSPAEIAVATVAGLLADRAGRSGGFYDRGAGA